MSCNCSDNPRTNNCENPCGASETNTAACESLPSQIQNFTTQFFGTVEKTEINGQVVWSLPCDLATGLPANPRGTDEGLACYFLRLFLDGITGLKGDTGPTGPSGTNGSNAFTVTTQSFNQPAEGGSVVVLTAYNPSILPGMYVFIATSGWYLVTNADTSGALSLTLGKSTVSPVSPVTAGKLVVPAGFPGQSIVGPIGPTGPTGPKGDNAEALTLTNVNYFATIGTDYPLPVSYTALDFTNSQPTILLEKAGKYIVTAIVVVKGQTGVLTADVATFKLRNVSTSSDCPGTEKDVNFLQDTQIDEVVINQIVETSGDNQNVAIFGKCTTNAKITAVALNTTITAVRIA